MDEADDTAPERDGSGCADHGRPDCLCDVAPLGNGVPIVAVPFPERLSALGADRLAFVTWAEEVAAWQDSQDLELVL